MISIYKIINTKNNKVYIGQTINDIDFRFKQHLRENRGSNLLHKDIRSISKSCCETTSKIKFLEWLQNEIK